MVNTTALKDPVTPVGRIPAVIQAPVAPAPTVYLIAVSGVLTQSVCASVPAADVREITEVALTVITPLKDKF